MRLVSVIVKMQVMWVRLILVLIYIIFRRKKQICFFNWRNSKDIDQNADNKSIFISDLDNLSAEICYFWKKKNIYINFLLKKIVKILVKV